MIVINVVIGGFSGQDVRLVYVTADYRYPITTKCPDYTFADYLEQNTVVYTPIAF